MIMQVYVVLKEAFEGEYDSEVLGVYGDRADAVQRLRDETEALPDRRWDWEGDFMAHWTEPEYEENYVTLWAFAEEVK